MEPGWNRVIPDSSSEGVDEGGNPSVGASADDAIAARVQAESTPGAGTVPVATPVPAAVARGPKHAATPGFARPAQPVQAEPQPVQAVQSEPQPAQPAQPAQPEPQAAQPEPSPAEASPHVQFWRYQNLAAQQSGSRQGPAASASGEALPAPIDASTYRAQSAQALGQAAVNYAEQTMANQERMESQGYPASSDPFRQASASLRAQQQETMQGRHAAVEVAPERPSALRSFLSFLIMLAIVLGAAWLLRTFVVAPYEIPSGSMIETIQEGDKVFSEKISYYLHGVNPGDIVTFDDPEVEGRTLIKRCIATGGQVVDLVDGVVYVDGQALDEPYTRGLPSEPLAPAPGVSISYPYTVPEGHIWVMGDNRTNSADSRYFGAVPESSVTGHACLTYWPFDRFGPLG